MERSILFLVLLACPLVMCNSCDIGFYDNNGACTECIMANLTSATGSIQSVTCDGESLQVQFESSFYNHSCITNQTFTALSSNSSCPQTSFSLTDGRFEFNISDCLLDKTITPEEIIFLLEFENDDLRNHTDQTLGGLIIDERQPRSNWNISCTFDRIQQVEVNNSVAVSNQVAEEFVTNVNETFEIQMQVFEDETYNNSMSYPIVKNFGEELHFEVSFDDVALPGQSDNFFLIIETCWATPNISEIAESNVTLIENNCESAQYSSILDIVDPRATKKVDQWSSRVFRFPDETQVVIRCRVKICYEESDCQRTCSQTRMASAKQGNQKVVEREVSSGLIIRATEEQVEDVEDDESSAIRLGYTGFLAVMFGLCML